MPIARRDLGDRDPRLRLDELERLQRARSRAARTAARPPALARRVRARACRARRVRARARARGRAARARRASAPGQARERSGRGLELAVLLDERLELAQAGGDLLALCLQEVTHRYSSQSVVRSLPACDDRMPGNEMMTGDASLRCDSPRRGARNWRRASGSDAYRDCPLVTRRLAAAVVGGRWRGPRVYAHTPRADQQQHDDDAGRRCSAARGAPAWLAASVWLRACRSASRRGAAARRSAPCAAAAETRRAAAMPSLERHLDVMGLLVDVCDRDLTGVDLVQQRRVALGRRVGAASASRRR